VEESELVEFVLLHASTSNPNLALSVINQVNQSELTLLLRGRVLPSWPHQHWLHSIVADIDRLITLYRDSHQHFHYVDSSVLSSIWSQADPMPLRLWQQGTFIAGPYLTVVGPRKPSFYAQTQTERLIRVVAKERVIVSGLAYGIDMLALRTAIDAGGQVVVVVPFGVANIYPSSHQQELESWVKSDRAMVISEYWSLESACKLHFWWRNRLMAAMARWLFLPEAANRSGTRKTAEYALNKGVSIATLPADITREQAYYSNKLIAEGAVTICDLQDWGQFCGVNMKEQMLSGKYLSLITQLRRGCFEPEVILDNLNISPAQFWRLVQGAEREKIVKKESSGRLVLL